MLTYTLGPPGTIVAPAQRMRSKQKKPALAAKAVKKVAARRPKKTGSGLAVANRFHASPRVVKHARATVQGLPSRAKKFVTSNPFRVLLGASAIGLVLAKLKQLV